MARKLPWKVESSPSTSRSTRPVQSAKRAQPRRPSRDEDTITTPKTRKPRRSSSPLDEPPQQEMMRQNGRDDLFVMVEDEFYSTAQMYSRHLHQAEYNRLKNLAAVRAAQVDTLLEKKETRNGNHVSIGALPKAKKPAPLLQTQCIDDEGDDDSDNESLIPDRNLASLMRRNKNALQSRSAHIFPAKALQRTRAAAGFAGPVSEPVQGGNRPLPSMTHDLTNTAGNADSSTDDEDELSSIWHRKTKPIPLSKARDSTSVAPHAGFIDDFLSDDLPKTRVLDTAKSRYGKKKLEPKASDAKIRLEEIPTFMF